MFMNIGCLNKGDFDQFVQEESIYIDYSDAQKRGDLARYMLFKLHKNLSNLE